MTFRRRRTAGVSPRPGPPWWTPAAGSSWCQRSLAPARSACLNSLTTWQSCKIISLHVNGQPFITALNVRYFFYKRAIYHVTYIIIWHRNYTETGSQICHALDSLDEHGVMCAMRGCMLFFICCLKCSRKKSIAQNFQQKNICYAFYKISGYKFATFCQNYHHNNLRRTFFKW